jgi:hypothetical protein
MRDTHPSVFYIAACLTRPTGASILKEGVRTLQLRQKEVQKTERLASRSKGEKWTEAGDEAWMKSNWNYVTPHSRYLLEQGVRTVLPLYKITLSEAFKLRRQSPFTLMSAVSQAESGLAKPAANR